MDPPVASPTSWSRLRGAIVLACHGLRGRRLLWGATCFGTGVGGYFALPVEPSAPQIGAVGVCVVLLVLLGWWLRQGVGLLALFAAALMAGLLVAALRTQVVAGPVLEFRYYGAVEGRVVKLDRSASGAPRITLDQVRLDGFAPDRTPRRVRLSMHGPGPVAPKPGARMMTTAHLSGPNGPAEPGGFDFQRHAWFQKLGAIGYSRLPLLQSGPADGGLALIIDRMRAGIGAGLRESLPGQRGEIAAAITTGDRSGLSAEVVEALRVSNLAHLLAISGLHMGLLVGFVFWATRGGLALWPAVALRHPTRAWAAAVALPFALFYLFLSGGSVATQRAFVMAVVMLGAILLGRKALSLRSVAIAALIVLLWRPESITGPGFQMSFAATGALVIAFRALTRLRQNDAWAPWFKGWRGAILSLLVSSIVAGAATAPFAALHFNRVGQLGVLANLLAVPAMGTLVMPLLLIGLILWPLGLEAGPFWLAGQGIAWIVWVAEWIASLPGAVSHVPAPQVVVLPLLGLSMALFGAARTVGRGIGLALFGLALGLWATSPRPALLISSDGRLVGTMTLQGRHLSRDTGAGFVASVWLENDGDGETQAEAATRAPPLKGLPDIWALRGKTGLQTALEECAERGGWLVTPVRVDAAVPGCRIFEERTLRNTGAIALYGSENDGYAPPWRMVTARETQGRRPWVPGQPSPQ
ncbi:ComEC/Rec2 family competence protein [Jannaschia sp. M317]|uniref:ComEC/Rec2 family competence protein n=1 Tax=Jannaschia sp. M317 TaxID=2867011 RepID=UPI0021A273B0|nr:ComEC/Rec2 family competence protein [Jannaschia sp. M317]UWQ16616.1 ComEC family competence protein [Jannaschia sp. M317]